jgi:hypothetical protein
MNPALALSRPGVVLAASKDPDAKITFLARGSGRPGDLDDVAVKVATTPAAGRAIEHEALMLWHVSDRVGGSLATTVPSVHGFVEVQGLPALVTGLMPGVPLSVRYNRHRHTARQRRVLDDHMLVAEWLSGFQAATREAGLHSRWPEAVRTGLGERWGSHPLVSDALLRVDAAAHRLGDRLPSGMVHGDFWFGNVLAVGDTVTGVVDWEHATTAGCPAADLARFALSYALYLDRHTRPGRRVAGHPELVRQGFGPGIHYALLGQGWYHDLVRVFLGFGLVRLGMPASAWYDVCLIGLAEIAWSANDEAFAAGHLRLLTGLPATAPS